MSRALSLLVLLLASCESYGVPDLDLERMIDQARTDPFEATPHFEEGQAMRRPPEGTIARSRLLGPPLLVEGREGDRFASRIPIPLSAPLLARGRERFGVYCAVCHGVLGDGRSQVAENMRLRKPPSLHEPALRAAPPGRIFAAITRGYGLMPAYAADLSIEERWAITSYVEALQLSQEQRVADLPPRLQKEAARWLE